MFCPGCGKEVSDDFQICPYCGVTIAKAQPKQQPSMVCQSCGKPITQDFKVCPYCGSPITLVCANCGKLLKPGFKVCPFCGTSASSHTKSAPTSPSPVLKTSTGKEKTQFIISCSKAGLASTIGAGDKVLFAFTDRRLIVANVGSGLKHMLFSGALMDRLDASKADKLLDKPVEDLLADDKSYAILFADIDQINLRKGNLLQRGTITVTRTNGAVEKFLNTSGIREEALAEEMRKILPGKIFQVF